MRTPTDTDQKLFRAHLSAVDFEQAMRFIDAPSKTQPSSVEWWGLMLAAIICYARPFSQNGRGKPKAAESRLFVDAPLLREILDSPTDRKLHRLILRLRKKAVAHSESRYAQLQIVRIGLNRVTEDAHIGFMWECWHPKGAQIDLLPFRRVTAALQAHCQFQRYGLRSPRLRGA
jgi:hypothetical protein